jgi:hypothetical protein
MSDSRKTKSELIAELADLRKRIVELSIISKDAEKETAPSNPLKHRPPRRPLEADIELIGVFDLIEARGINLSEGGISLKTADNLPFEMRYTLDGKTITREAHLIWLKHTENGGYNFGFKFINEETFPSF